MRAILLTLIFLCLPIRADNTTAATINAELGLAYLSQGYYPASKTALLNAIHEGPQLATSWYSMGYYLEKTGNITQADAYYQKAIAVDKHSGDAKNNYGTYLCRQKHYHAAIQEFLAATEEPSYLHIAQAFENAGECAMKIPDCASARGYFKKAMLNGGSGISSHRQSLSVQ